MRKSALSVKVIEDKVIVQHGYNTMMVLDMHEADDLVTKLDAEIYDEHETHKYLLERNTYLETRNEQLEHENIRMSEEIELCR